MTRVLALAAVCWLLLGADDARAVTVVRPDGGDVTWYEGVVAAAHVPAPRGVVELHVGPCEGRQEPACAQDGSPPRVDLDVARLGGIERQTWLHELGHVFDYSTLGPGHRAYFERVLGDARPWRSAANSPHEQFAEAYAACARDQRKPESGGYAYGYEPTPGQHRRVCRMIRRAGGWR